MVDFVAIQTVTYHSPNKGATRKQRQAQKFFQAGWAHQQKKEWQDAIACYDKAIAAYPQDRFPALCNRGMCYFNLSKPFHSLRDYEDAFRVGTPELRDVIRVNRGVLFNNVGRYDEALVDFYRDGSDPSLLNAAYIHLRRGEFEKGLKLYRLRPTAIDWKDSVTDLSKFENKNIAIIHEQGFGDSIQMCRFVPDILKVAKSVKWATQPQLASLLKHNFPQIEVINKSETIARALAIKSDAYTLVMDLWELCGRKLNGAPYLKPDRPIGLPAGRCIGLAWRGRTSFADDHNRSMSLDKIWPDIPEAKLIALQKDLRDDEKQTGIFDGGSLYSDFLGLAAVLGNLDAVISVDTAVAHLAGAMGIRTALLLPYANDWRWGERGNTTGWYDSVRIFRQPKFGDWGPPVREASEWVVRGKI